MTVRVSQQEAEGQPAPASDVAQGPALLLQGSQQQSPAKLTLAVVSVNANAQNKLVTHFTVEYLRLGEIRWVEKSVETHLRVSHIPRAASFDPRS